MNEEQMAKCFNEWMDRYTKDPAAFMHDFESVMMHLQERATGQESSYGASCAAMMIRIKGDLAI